MTATPLTEAMTDAAMRLRALRHSDAPTADLARATALLADEVGAQMIRLGISWADLEAAGHRPISNRAPDAFTMDVQTALAFALQPIIESTKE